MIAESFLMLFPLILLVLGGFFFSRFFSISESMLIRCVTDFFMPLLVFHALVTSDINLAQTLKLGAARTVVLVASSLPSAVFSVVLPIRYGVNSQFAAGMVLLSTAIGVLTIPLAIYLSEIL